MVPSSSIAIGTDGKRLMCSGFSLGELVRLGNFEFIIDYFSGLSPSPGGSNKGAIFMASIHSRASTLQRAMIEDSADEYLTTSSREGGVDHLSPRRHGMRALRAPTSTTTWREAPSTMRFPLWTAVSRPETNFLSERCHHNGRLAQARVRHPYVGPGSMS
jgi:hypothetical protein